MRTPIKWLEEYIKVRVTPDELFERLTMAGMEVEKVEEIAGDTVFEIEVTPNRPDCLSVLGIAREVSAVTDRDVRFPETNEYRDSGRLEIDIKDEDDCPRYIGAVIEGVTVGKTPKDMADYLLSLDMSGVNNIVDITNFSLFENGQPLHAFDYDKLAGGKIIVRRAKKGETIVALDDNTYELDEEVLVIADAEKPVAIAGIMGGKETGVTADTKNILLESAYFNPALIRRTSRKLGLSSDSCYRFERGVHWYGVDVGAHRATDLILDIAGGNVTARRDVSANKVAPRSKEIRLSEKKIEAVLGTTVDVKKAETILKRLGCDVKYNAPDFVVMPPTQRGDLKIAEDVVEEVARVIGYDNLPMSLPLIKAENIPTDHERGDIKPLLNETMRGFGFSEIIPFSMTNQAALEKCSQGELPRSTIRNPLSLEQEALRPSMLPSFMGIYQTNFRRGQRDLRLFELGKIYPSGQDEKPMLGLLLSGQRRDDWRDVKKEAIDFYDLKGTLEQLMTTLCIENTVYEPGKYPGLVEGQTAVIKKGNDVIGYGGAIDKDVLKQWGIKKSVAYFAMLDVAVLDNYRGVSRKLTTISEFPSMTRDIAVSVKSNITYKQIKDVCLQKAPAILKDISFVELYMGDTVPEGYRGLTISFRYQSDERTLTDDDVTPVHDNIRQQLADTLEVLYR